MGLLERTEDRKGRWPTRRHLGQRRIERDDDLDFLAHNLAERVASARSGLLGPGDAAERRRGDPVPAWRADHVLHMLEMGLQQDHGDVRHARRMEDTDRIIRRSILRLVLLFLPGYAVLLVLLDRGIGALR
ncbi:MAG: hypothetical protein ACO3VG_02660 [Nitriliruptoraceae bacterium]